MRRSKMELCPVRGRILACTYHQSPPRCPKSQRAGVQGASRSSRGRYHNTTTTESETNANLASKVHFCRAASVSVNDTQCQLGSRVTIMWRKNKSELQELRPAGGAYPATAVTRSGPCVVRRINHGDVSLRLVDVSQEGKKSTCDQVLVFLSGRNFFRVSTSFSKVSSKATKPPASTSCSLSMLAGRPRSCLTGMAAILLFSFLAGEPQDNKFGVNSFMRGIVGIENSVLFNLIPSLKRGMEWRLLMRGAESVISVHVKFANDTHLLPCFFGAY